MSCSLCHYISGHDPGCRYCLEDAISERAEQGQKQEDLSTRIEALEARVEQLVDKVTNYAELKKLYADSRDHVHALVKERDDLIEASRRHVTECDALDTEVARMRPVYEAAKRVRSSLPTSASDLRARSFHPATCDLVEAVDEALAAEIRPTPYRSTP